MADKNQSGAQRAVSEAEISVDMNAADPNKAVSRRSTDIARDVRDVADQDDANKPRTKAEKELFKRMGRLERNLTKQFDQRRADDEARHQRELADMRAKIDKVSVDRDGDDKADAAHEAAISALKDKLAAAYEKGDSVESANITLQISKLDAQFWAKKAAAAGVATREAARPDGQQRQHQETPPKRSEPTIQGSRFIKANEDWWEDPEFEVEKGAANAIFIQLRDQEGFDAKDAEMYKELAKRMKAKFPKLDIKTGRKADDGPGDDDDDDDEARQRERDDEGRGDGEQRAQRRQAPAGALQDRGPAGNRNNGNRVTLTKQDIETMKACRLDPDNDRDVVQFMKERTALEAAQA